MKTLTLESLKEVCAQLEAAPKIPMSISFSSDLDRECALEAWQAKFSDGRSMGFHGVPLKIAPALPKNVIMFLYPDKMAFFNVESGKSWSLPCEQNLLNEPLKMRRETV